jgi:hypothetical protein
MFFLPIRIHKQIIFFIKKSWIFLKNNYIFSLKHHKKSSKNHLKNIFLFLLKCYIHVSLMTIPRPGLSLAQAVPKS